MTTQDLAGALVPPTMLDTRVHYDASQWGRVGYSIIPSRRAPLHRERSAAGHNRLEDRDSGLAGEGPSYLDALRDLEQAARAHRGDYDH